MGLPVESNFPIDKLNDPEYTTALGLVIWGDKNIDEGGSFFNNITAVKQSTDKMRSWFRSLWPSS